MSSPNHATPLTSDPASSPEGDVSMHPAHQAAWTAALDEDVLSTVVHGATVQSPIIATRLPNRFDKGPSSDRSSLNADSKQAPSDGFVLSGSITLFGLDNLQADFYTHHGPPPPHVTLPEDEVAIYQMAVLKKDIRLSTLLPPFAGTAFDILDFKDVILTYQNYALDRTKAAGWHFEADIVFDETYGSIHDVLSKFLGIKDPNLHLSCGLGLEQDWHKPLQISSFIMEGLFPGVSASPCTGVVMTSIGARLLGFHCIQYATDGSVRVSKEYGFGVFGTLLLDVPGSSAPLELLFEISEQSEVLHLSGEARTDWKHAFGIKDLTLKNVTLSVDIGINSPFSDMTFDVEATFEAGSTFASLRGTFSMDGSFSLSANFEHLGLEGLDDIFNHLLDDTLAPPHLNVEIGGATLSLSKDSGIELELHDVRVEDYAAFNGTLSLGSGGAVLRASMDDGSVKIGDFHISESTVEISFGRVGKGTETSVMLLGKIAWNDFTLDVGVHVYEAKETGALEYTIYGRFTHLGDGEAFALNSLVPSLGDSFLGKLALEDAALIIASADDPSFGAISHSGYSCEKGIQVCAALGEIEAMKGVMRGTKHPQLILRAGWTEATGFELDVLLPAPMKLQLGRGVTTDEIKIRVVTQPPTLKLLTGAKIVLQSQPDPLHFMLDIDLDMMEASATGQLSGGWKNPFGISEELTVGPDLAMKISIIYEQFLISGTPSGFGFVGGLQVGKVVGKVAFEVDEVPSRELLSVEVGNIDIQDLVALASNVTRVKFPEPPKVIEFHEVQLYVCPMGVTIGTISYPRGFSFASRMTIFGINADIKVVIKDKGVHITGGIDPFSLGFLTVKGVKEPQPLIDLELSAEKQRGKIDGVVVFLGVESKLTCAFELTPKFTFEFDFKLTFGDGLFLFDVHAAPINTLDEQNHAVSGTDYELTAKLHQNILSYIEKKVTELFDHLAKEQKEEAEAAQADIDREREAHERNVNSAQSDVDTSFSQWKKRSDEAHAHAARVRAEDKAKMEHLQGELDQVTAQLRRDSAAASAKLSAANADRAARMRDEQNNLRRKKEEWDQTMAQKHRELDDATRDLHSGFGDVEHNIEEAKRRVDSLQNEINNISWHINDCDNAAWWDVPQKAAIPGLFIAKEALEVAKGVADAALDVANAVVHAGDFIACKGAMEAASLAVDVARVTGDAAIETAQVAVEAVDKVTAEAIELAQAGLAGVERLGEAAVMLAGKAVQEYTEVREAILEAAEKVVAELENCAEWVAYSTATAALAAAKATVSAGLWVVKEGVAITEEIVQDAIALGKWIIEKIFGLVDITDIILTATLGKNVGGFAFSADVKGRINGEPFHFTLAFDTRNVVSFITSLFEELVPVFKETTKK